MAGGVYTIDPTTGQPILTAPSGASIPLPLSEDEMRGAGLSMAGPPGLPPAPDRGPDMRLALGPGGGPMDMGGADPAMAQFIADQKQQAGIDATRTALTPREAPRSHPTIDRAAELERIGSGPAPGKPGQAGVDPGSLARPGQGGGAPAGGGGQSENADEAAIRDQLMREAMAGGGGGGPRRLGITGETQKLKTYERAMDPELAAQARQAQLASEGYNEQLAISLRDRQQQAYDAQQGEYAARAGQLQAAQERYDQQQAMIQDYAARRDNLLEEARQMKAPDQRQYWQEAGTVGRLTAGLSMVFGGALQGLRGGQNEGLAATRDAVNDWMKVRREEYDRAQTAADRADTQLGRLVQQFGSENQALDHMRLQAWEVRDSMLKGYADKIGTPDALEIYNQAMLQSEAEKAALLAKASQGAEVEIEQKLSMQGGGGGRKTLKQALHDTAEGVKDYREIAGGGQKDPERAVTTETTDAVGGALTAISAARNIKSTLRGLNVADDDTDDPRSGAYDAITKNIPGTDVRKRGQDLDMQTFQLARGAQKSLGKSDNDADLAGKQAVGLGGSGRERWQGADQIEKEQMRNLKLHVAGMTPAQRSAWVRALPPDQKEIVREVIESDNRPAASEQVVR